ncbi:MAG: 50S ribosomal protein L11 methyltransferase [Candidatus Andeanibacterium colombiense]|uniref:Ribosomal protein L11 methyltransferase n=1 Tax=Candidatus Andeanibacterium colombiense TaxID=3121345 RepID=A0AAJ6BQ77_9SPHN|nr:MAG: 50S ribosomal protein L11 methyltransferase [Sphingomonadaceae bacterium]
MSWKVSVYASKEVIQAALVAHEDAFDWDPAAVLSGSEIAEDQPDDWVLEAWFADKPGKPQQRMVKELFGSAGADLTIEKLPDEDWVTLSQHIAQPIDAGRFHVRTPDFAADTSAGVTDFVIPASQAFGTGQHETTAGCLEMLTAMKARGTVVRNLADIGTGTGLLAFAALDLWPRALATASDIDAVCVGVVDDNAALNRIPLGAGSGEVTMVVAPGMDHPLLEARGPYDLLIANILAGPLVELAGDFGRAVVPGGSLLLAGLLETQEPAVRRACARAGFRLAERMVRGDWSILWLRKRPAATVRTSRQRALPEWSRHW